MKLVSAAGKPCTPPAAVTAADPPTPVAVTAGRSRRTGQARQSPAVGGSRSACRGGGRKGDQPPGVARLAGAGGPGLGLRRAVIAAHRFPAVIVAVALPIPDSPVATAIRRRRPAGPFTAVTRQHRVDDMNGRRSARLVLPRPAPRVARDAGYPWRVDWQTEAAR